MRLPVRLLQFGAAVPIIAGFGIIGTWSVRLAVADYWFRQENLSGTERAIRIEPDASEYYKRLAILLQEQAPAASTEALRHALELNPRDSESRIELALRAEASGDLAAAERGLLAAAEVDKMYLPRWSLANFYFRHNQYDRFWFWARQAVDMSYGDVAPLFSLCWEVTGDATIIEQKLDIRRADVAANYLAYLTAGHRDEAIPGAAKLVLAGGRNADVPALLAACDRLIADEHPDAALQVWNDLAQLHRIPYEMLQPARGRVLTNGSFREFPSSQGFDWRLNTPPGITALLQERPAGLWIKFDGRQPEAYPVLMQYLPVSANARYEARFRYITSGIARGSGLVWRVTDSQGIQTLAEGKSLASPSQSEQRLTFQTSPATRLVRLVLVYQRVLGTTRIEGSITLLGIDILAIPGAPS